MTDMVREWLSERDTRHLANALKRAAIDDQLVVRFLGIKERKIIPGC